MTQKASDMHDQWSPGDWAVYRKSKRSTSPGPRAEHVVASTKGETYTYVVDKFWVVESVLPENRLLLRTAKGKTHTIDTQDPNLRKPSWIQRLLWRNRFREAEVHRQDSNESHLAAG